MAAMATSIPAGYLVRKLVSLGRPPAATSPSRYLSTVRYSDTFDTPATSSSDDDEDEDIADTVVFHDRWDYRPHGGGGRGFHEMWRDNEGLHARLDMPGLGMEHVKLDIELGALTIGGKGPEEAGKYDRSDVAVGMKYFMSLIPAFKLSEIRMEMKNGVLNVQVPTAEVGDSSVWMQVREYDD